MPERLKVKVQAAPCFGTDGLVGKVAPLLLASACGRSMLKTQDHLSLHGSIGQPILPDPLSMQIGEAGIAEPMAIHLSFMRRVQRERWFTEHPIGVREITRLTLTTPMPLRSNSSQKIIESGVLATRTGLHLCSKLNLIVTAEKSTQISGCTCRSSSTVIRLKKLKIETTCRRLRIYHEHPERNWMTSMCRP